MRSLQETEESLLKGLLWFEGQRKSRGRNDWAQHNRATTATRSIVLRTPLGGSVSHFHNPQWCAAAVPTASVTIALLVRVVKRILPDGKCDSTPARCIAIAQPAVASSAEGTLSKMKECCLQWAENDVRSMMGTLANLAANTRFSGFGSSPSTLLSPAHGRRRA